MSDESLRPSPADVNPFKVPVRYLGEVETPTEMMDRILAWRQIEHQTREHGIEPDDAFVLKGER